MKTNISAEKLANPAVAHANDILSRCTNCGCCNAACPTFELTGDEREAPRGRINLIRDMLEHGGAPKADTVTHIDNCLSCLSCTVACPSGVDYMHLVDHARAHIEQNHRRGWGERVTRTALSQVLAHPQRFRAAMAVGRMAKPLAGVLRKSGATRHLGAMLDAIPAAPATAVRAQAGGVHAAVGERSGRVIVPAGCVQPTLDPSIDRSAIRLLNHVGVEVVVPQAAGCCGALKYHLGEKDAARAQMRRNIDDWWPTLQAGGVDAILVTASGCGTTVRDYGHILGDDPAYAGKAAQVSRLAMDVTAFLTGRTLPAPKVRPALRVAYHAACSLQHGQGLLNEPKDLLRAAGFTVVSPKDEHLCCGSAGTYSILHAETAERLRDLKVANLERGRPDVIAGGNIGCLQHIGAAAGVPVVHTVALLEWAWTGVVPEALARVARAEAPVAASVALAARS